MKPYELGPKAQRVLDGRAIKAMGSERFEAAQAAFEQTHMKAQAQISATPGSESFRDVSGSVWRTGLVAIPDRFGRKLVGEVSQRYDQKGNIVDSLVTFGVIINHLKDKLHYPQEYRLARDRSPLVVEWFEFESTKNLIAQNILNPSLPNDHPAIEEGFMYLDNLQDSIDTIAQSLENKGLNP